MCKDMIQIKKGFHLRAAGNSWFIFPLRIYCIHYLCNNYFIYDLIMNFFFDKYGSVKNANILLMVEKKSKHNWLYSSTPPNTPE